MDRSFDRPDLLDDQSEENHEDQKNENEPVKRSKGFISAENDQTISAECLNQYIDSDAGKRLCRELMRHISSKMRDRSRAEDVYQDALKAAIERVKKGAIPEKDLRPYMY